MTVDFLLSPEHVAFRDHLRELLAGEAMRRALREGSGDHPDDPDPRPAYRLLGRRGWLAPDWPPELGGAGLDAATASILTEELAAHGIPDSAHVNSVRNAGRCLLLCGDERQRTRLLPPMARGEVLAAVLYSEPDAGSDLASLTTTARPRDDGWELHGTKVHSVKTAHCDLAIVAARTSRHPRPLLGITLFTVGLRSPGVTVRPVAGVNHEPFHEVVLDGVRVGPDDAVGGVDEGWLVITEGLAVERVGMDYSARVRAHLEWLRRRAARGGQGAALAGRLRRLSTAAEAGRLLAWSMAGRLRDGDLDPAEAAQSKWFNSELMREVWRLGRELSSPYDLLTVDDPGAPPDPSALLLDREAPGLSLSAGTSEMMLQVIAGELGLEAGDAD
ncbi:acyl-CoA dehydrogenase family protein [Streptomyces coeruleorubidus]|uniref:acyl-CoA dehydrogenase family protein n=1 Tax=Streptomyces coeruleorubidus TaxID=116188 RepID=UPI0036C013CB